MHVDVRQNEPPRVDRVLNDGERPRVFAPEILNTTPMPPSQTERPSPGFTTSFCTSIFDLLSTCHSDVQMS